MRLTSGSHSFVGRRHKQQRPRCSGKWGPARVRPEEQQVKSGGPRGGLMWEAVPPVLLIDPFIDSFIHQSDMCWAAGLGLSLGPGAAGRLSPAFAMVWGSCWTPPPWKWWPSTRSHGGGPSVSRAHQSSVLCGFVLLLILDKIFICVMECQFCFDLWKLLWAKMSF